MTTGVYQRTRRDPHELLGVPRGAGRDDVIQAFRRMVRRGGHPDTGGDAATFDQLVRARDVLLEEASAGPANPAPRPKPQATSTPPREDREDPAREDPPRANRSAQRESSAQGTASRANQPRAHPHRGTPPASTSSAPTSRLAVVTVVLALLGPFLWPLAIGVGLVARRRIKRTGAGGGALVVVVLFFLCVLTLPVLVRFLTMMLVP